METRTAFETVTHSPEETMELGRKLSKDFKPPCLILLEGELGSGKTTLVKGIVEGLGVASEKEVTSPSYTLVHEYGCESKVYHVDLYRIEEARELATLGLEDILGSQATVIVEWGEKLGKSVPAPRVRIRLEYLGNDDRRVIVERLGV